MTPDDLAALHAACFETPRPWSAAEFLSLLADPHCFLLTASGSALLGRVIADDAELLTLAVSPDHRRRGTGARLTQDFLTTATQKGATSAFLEVAATNTAAIALYHAAGFTQVGTRRAYYKSAHDAPIDALVMQKSLENFTKR